MKSKIYLLFLVTLVFINLKSAAQTYNLHWGSAGWTAGSTSGTITNIGGSGVNATVTMVNSAAGTWLNSSPIVGTTGGINWFLPGLTAGNPMVLWVDWANLTSTVTTAIKFSRPVTNISFYLGDMDRTNPLTYVDRFTFTATNNRVAVPNPIVTKFQAAFTAPDTVLINGNTAYGNSALSNGNSGTSSLTSQGATILVQYSNPVDSITLFWDQGPGAAGNPVGQAVVIGDIAFSKIIPEYPPTADNFTNAPMSQANGATVIPGLVASDLDGTISSFRIKSVPPATEGVLSIPCPPTPAGATCTGGFANLTAAVLAANPAGIVLTPAQAAAMRFDPTANFAGNASFTFDATDNNGNLSNTATYILPVVSLPPVSNNIMENSMPNTNGPTAIQGLSSADVDGTIASYSITTLPAAGEGVISVPCPPTPTGSTCTGGFADLTAAVLLANPGGIPLTPTQMAAMRFDPAPGFIGKATFDYNATDNNGNLSNTANYTIPVSATPTTARPPLADNITSQILNNSLGNTAIPDLKANDLDGAVVSYTISTIPAPATGVLRLTCPSTPLGLTCTGGFADIIPGTVLTPAESQRLVFDPAPGFTGTASFTYFATDNSNLTSNIANYNLPIVNVPPTATNINTIVPFNAAATAIPALAGKDADGTITGYTITTVPSAVQGVLSVPCPPTPAGGTCTGGFVDLTPAVLAANPAGIALTPAQAAGLRFDPATGFSGTAPFNYTTTDNNGNISAPAVYNITMDDQPPVTTDIVNAVIANTSGATAVNALNGTDPDGTIASYTLLGVPDATQGVLSIPCPATPPGATCTGGFANLTAAVLAANVNGISLTPAQAAALRFDPTAGYTGLAAFKYAAIDNSGNLSNISTYTIPVSGAGNIPPVARNITTPPMPSTNGVTAIPTLVGTDDGTIVSYTLNSVPSASQGVLSIPCPATPAGATCTGGFANLTPAVLAANPNGIVLTTAQAAGMRFDPDPNFSGKVEFSYITTDNNGATSAGAVYTIPVTSLPPVANPVIAPVMSHNNGATAIPSLIASDPDGTIATYYIESLPQVSQGVLSIPCPPTPTGATCTGGFADLTAAVLANYPVGGIPLTPAQMAAMRFDPSVNYKGDVVFNYHATDNSGVLSNSTTYTIPVSDLPPVSEDILAPKMLNTNGPTAIPSLSSNDADGTIATYVINSLPPVSQGVISIPCPPTPSGATCSGGFASLTAAVLAANPGGIVLTPAQAAGLRLDPAAGYIGNVIFNYAAYDNTGNLSNIANYTIPVGNALALPLTLINFSGQRINKDITVYWKTENEVNTDHFDVEYSTNGINYVSGGMVNAKNGTVNNYQLTMFNYTLPLYYIRLKSVDVGGAFKYSNTIIITLNDKLKKSLTVLPNPVTDKLNVKVTSDMSANAQMRIVNNLGQVLFTRNAPLVKGDNLVVISGISEWPAGVYTLQVMIENEMMVTRVVKK